MGGQSVNFTLGLAAISGTVAGLLAVGVVSASQKLGGTLGGLLASVPSIVVVASIGVAIELDDPADVRNAMFAAPSGGLMITLYILIAWVWLPAHVIPGRWHKLWVMVATALVVWSALTLPWVFVVFKNLMELEVMNDPGYQLSQAICFLFYSFLIAILAGPGLQRHRRSKSAVDQGSKAQHLQRAKVSHTIVNPADAKAPWSDISVANRGGDNCHQASESYVSDDGSHEMMPRSNSYCQAANRSYVEVLPKKLNVLHASVDPTLQLGDINPEHAVDRDTSGQNDTATEKRKLPWLLLLRFWVGFGLVFTVVCISRVDPVLGAALSVFPALGTSNQVLLWHSNGKEMVRELSKSMIVGYHSCYTYALLFGIIQLKLGKWAAAGVAWTISFLTISVPLFFAMK